MELFKINELRQHQFIQVPKELLYNPRYKTLSSDSKLIYGLLLDRMELSRKNNWINENNEIYLIFTRNNIQNILNISDKTCTKAFKQLTNTELIKEVRQGLGKPNLIFIGHIVYDDPQTVENSQNRKNYDSAIENFTVQESEIFRPNNTNTNNTNIILEEEETHHEVEVDPKVFKMYRECITNNVSDRELLTLEVLQNSVGKELLNKAIILANMKNGKNLGYIQTVLQDWNEKGLNTIEKVNNYLTQWVTMNKKAKENREKQTKKKSESKFNKSIEIINNKKPSTFNNFEQRTYDFEDLEKKLLGWD